MVSFLILVGLSILVAEDIMEISINGNINWHTKSVHYQDGELLLFGLNPLSGINSVTTQKIDYKIFLH